MWTSAPFFRSFCCAAVELRPRFLQVGREERGNFSEQEIVFTRSAPHLSRNHAEEAGVHCPDVDTGKSTLAIARGDRAATHTSYVGREGLGTRIGTRGFCS